MCLFHINTTIITIVRSPWCRLAVGGFHKPLPAWGNWPGMALNVVDPPGERHKWKWVGRGCKGAGGGGRGSLRKDT